MSALLLIILIIALCLCVTGLAAAILKVLFVGVVAALIFFAIMTTMSK